MVMVGVGGSGKRSLTVLSSFLAQAKYITIKISKKYTKKDFKTDLFAAMFIAGTEKSHVIFQLSD
jgi:dynein heavy chain